MECDDKVRIDLLIKAVGRLAEAIDHLASNLPAGLNVFHHQRRNSHNELPLGPTWGVANTTRIDATSGIE